MPKDRIAEWLLVLVTSRERAASIVGDLMESSATRGRIWWWSAVLRAVVSLLWNGFAASPLDMLGLALLAWLLGLLLVVVSTILALISISVGDALVLNLTASKISISGITAHKAVVGIIATLCQFFVGCWIARRAPDRALSAWLALLIMDQFTNALFSIVGLALGSQEWAWQPPNWHLGVVYLSCLAGTIWVRKRAVT